MLQKPLLIACISVLSTLGIAQPSNTSQEEYQLDINPTTENIVIDGHLKEAIWQSFYCSKRIFWIQSPIDGDRTDKRTEVRMSYDDKYVYLSAICWDDPEKIIQTLKRDNYGQSDEFAVVIDPIKTTNQWFIRSPLML